MLSDEDRRRGAEALIKAEQDRKAIPQLSKTFPNIDPNRFQTIGRGSANPIADNATEAGRQLNRRTEIKVVLSTE